MTWVLYGAGVLCIAVGAGVGTSPNGGGFWVGVGVIGVGLICGAFCRVLKDVA